MGRGEVIYQNIGQLETLLAEKLITKRAHPKLPLWIYNYSASAQGLGISQWSPTLCDCRGLILDHDGEIVARGFKKFWNFSQVLDRIPASEDFTVWEKLDGSLGLCFWYGNDFVVATRGSFESDQARWATNHMKDASGIRPGFSYLTEILYPENRIVVDYGDRRDMPLLAVLDMDGRFRDDLFDEWPASKARRFDGLRELDRLTEFADPGAEGFVVRWASGYMAKCKTEEYCRLHKLITQCSTRTIWELLRAGEGTSELLDRVPAEFGVWVKNQIRELTENQNDMVGSAHGRFQSAPKDVSRKDFAEYAKKQDQPGLLFALLDGKPIEDMCWKLIEPAWATPFKGDVE